MFSMPVLIAESFNGVATKHLPLSPQIGFVKDRMRALMIADVLARYSSFLHHPKMAMHNSD